jgi:hypothetical protein
VHPPKDFDRWARVCVNIIRHYNEGWADGFRHNIRYWEIWNEPDLMPPSPMWTGTAEEYFRLYAVAAEAIKAHDSALKVGGRALAGLVKEGPGTSGKSLRVTPKIRSVYTPVMIFLGSYLTRLPGEVIYGPDYLTHLIQLFFHFLRRSNLCP